MEKLTKKTDDILNSSMFRMVIRGTSVERTRPGNRLGGGSITASLSKRNITDDEGNLVNWIGNEFMETNGQMMPSLNQISKGL